MNENDTGHSVEEIVAHVREQLAGRSDQSDVVIVVASLGRPALEDLQDTVTLCGCNLSDIQRDKLVMAYEELKAAEPIVPEARPQRRPLPGTPPWPPRHTPSNPKQTRRCRR